MKAKCILKTLSVVLLLALFLGACNSATNPVTGPDNDTDQERTAAYALNVVKEGALLTEFVFPSVYPGYGEVAGLEVAINNTGTGPAEGIAIGLKGTGAEAFAVSPAVIERLEAGAAASFRVSPKTGIGGGEYRAVVSVTDPGGTEAGSVNVKFIVSTTLLYGITLDTAAGGYVFPPEVADYAGVEPLTVTITNIGNEGTGALGVILGGETPEAFQTDPASIGNIEAGGTGTFTVQLVNGLGEGSYAATVTVSGGNAISAAFPVSFQVFGSQIQIGTVEELAAIGATSPADGVYRLTADLVLENWTPITNTSAIPFTGVFDGNGHAITVNSFDPAVLNTDPDLRLKGYIGVFGYIKGGRVENLTVDLQMPQEQTLSNAKPGLGKDQFIGGVSGYAEDTEFENIRVTGDLNLSKADSGNIYIGGVTGYLKGGSIAASHITTNLTAQEPYTAGNGGAYVGGFVGKVMLAAIRESDVSGVITAYAERGGAYAGGAAGYAESTRLYRIAVRAAINGEVSKGTAVIATFTNFLYAGGITGFIGGNDSSMLSEIRECFSTGAVTGASYALNVGDNTVWVGGIVGRTSGWSLPTTIIDCYSRGNVTAMTAPGYSGSNAMFYAGGIAGETSSVNIQNSYVAGIITANNNQAAGNHTYAGGIAAVMDGRANETITIQSCAALSPQINWRLYTKDDMILKRIGIRGVYVDMGVSNRYALQGLAGKEKYPENTTLSNNIANADMVINYEPSTQQTAKVPAIILDPGPDTVDGANADAKPVQSVFEGLGWDFNTVWTMGSDGYPALRNTL